MKFATNALFSITLFVVLVPFLSGQQAVPTSDVATTQPQSNPAPASCTHLFTSGKSNSNAFLQYCVSDDGMITSIQTPFGHYHLGAQGEGYGFCQESPAVEYHDYVSGDSGNWNPPQVVSV